MDGQTVAGSGSRAAGKNDPLYQAGVGDSGRPGQVVLQWTVTPVNRLEKAEGDQQQTDPDQDFPNLLRARAFVEEQPMPRAAVTFTVVSGGASFNGATQAKVVADVNGYATAPVLTAGQAAGPVRVVAASGNAQTEFLLTIASATQYEVEPGGPPDVGLVPGGAAVGYPGVVVEKTGAAPLGEQEVTVELPAGKGLQWGSAGQPDYQLSVLDGGVYPGTLSPDGLTLTFKGVNLDVPEGLMKVLYVCVSAAPEAAAGYTALTFTVGGKASDSTPVLIGTPVVGPPFSASPGGPPEDLLEPAGAVRYPGVKLTKVDDGPVSPLTVTVRLPQDTQLLWGKPGAPDHQLTVHDLQTGTNTVYTGTLSDDGQSLTFTNVDPRLPAPGAESLMWVGVSAAADAAPAYTSLVFSLDDQECASTPVKVEPAPVFVVEPGGPPDVTLVQGEPAPGYPGVRVRNTSSSTLHADMAVTVALPAGSGLSFVAEAGADYQLTVNSPVSGEVQYTGNLSDDQQSLTFDKVRLDVTAGETVELWVAVRAAQSSPAGPAELTFTVNSSTSSSTPIDIVAPAG
ncbi:hypothetical protein [Streptomyces albofaciens]|uniref:hypothetical protein n=1 Tax=Streptomyces albofaciens TaxID=66866 RepID=UPI0012392F4F|nr:hypothetical protein [Streptomyces albofaciens]